MNLNAILKEKIAKINTALTDYMSYEENPQSIIYDAMKYSLFAGGKRLRPVIMLLVSDMLSGDENEVMPFACAMEMIHTYSLIHDDLPSMDNDDLRRGKPTNHKVYGEAMAILAGDSLLNKAFEITAQHKYINPERALSAIAVLANSSGTEGMIGGQTVDIQSEGKKISEDELLYLHTLKTGAIIRSSGVIGAIMAGALEEQMTAIDEFCKNLGIAFQVQDDLLDVTGSEQELGKPIGSDSDSEKTTFVNLFGIEGTKKAVSDYTKKAISALDIFGEKANTLIELANYLINRSN